MSEPLATLVARAQAGDDEAFHDLVERCRARIYRWAVVATGDHDDAEDVTQEVVIHLYRRLGTFRGEAQFTTWLYRVVRNAAGGLRRRYRRHERKVERLLQLGAAVPRGSALVAEHVENQEIRAIVQTLFRALPERQRMVFDLVDLQGLAPAEAADMLDMKPVTLRAHLFKARRAIRERILESTPELVEDR